MTVEVRYDGLNSFGFSSEEIPIDLIVGWLTGPTQQTGTRRRAMLWLNIHF
jgi:hypothetical protein